jgi:type IV secretory pathway VirB10-like protein
MKLLGKAMFLGIVLALGFLALNAQSSQVESSPQQSPPAEQPPPAAAPTPQTESPAQNQTAAPQPAPQPRDANQPVLKHKYANRKTSKKAKTSPAGKVVVRNGGAKEGSPELAPGTNKEQQLHERENTNQLLATTDANLKTVAGRQLTSAQQSMVEQIRNYMAQSKAATNAGDLDRAHTLAYKAHLLSDELAKK